MITDGFDSFFYFIYWFSQLKMWQCSDSSFLNVIIVRSKETEYLWISEYLWAENKTLLWETVLNIFLHFIWSSEVAVLSRCTWTKTSFLFLQHTFFIQMSLQKSKWVHPFMLIQIFILLIKVILRDKITGAETSDDDTVFFIIKKVQHVVMVKKDCSVVPIKKASF